VATTAAAATAVETTSEERSRRIAENDQAIAVARERMKSLEAERSSLLTQTTSVLDRVRGGAVNCPAAHRVGFGGPGEEIRLEAITIVCDYGDGRVAAQQVTISYGSRRLVVDLCAQHLRELTKNARAPRPGRRRKVAGAPVVKPRGRPPGSKNKATASKGRRKTSRKKARAKRPTAARKRAASKTATA
jgi:hypothetical protein